MIGVEQISLYVLILWYIYKPAKNVSIACLILDQISLNSWDFWPHCIFKAIY